MSHAGDLMVVIWGRRILKLHQLLAKVLYFFNFGQDDKKKALKSHELYEETGFCEGNTRNRWRDGQVCPDVDKELWRLGPDGSGVFWRPDRGKGERAEIKDKGVRERERTEGGGETEKRERRRKESRGERGDGKRVGERERVKPALNREKG
ncbi:hypothetical protein TNCV_4226151 [Trichonephila clavipes]|uniref:Uncharacterized protein n=1 Tax=Trichonephila clavipes TaxID=2585209 RepID=A0A8X6T3D3_TRICX|nr:hypothetical protein TNCV_4226151 [Trichonephila clavipes]